MAPRKSRAISHDRLAAQLWIISLFDGSIKCVHVHVDDFADAHLATILFPFRRRAFQNEPEGRQHRCARTENPAALSPSSKEIALGAWMMKHPEAPEEVAADIGSPHRFGAKEFRVGSAEVGHVHIGGIVDIPLPRFVRDALVTEGLAEDHRWLPNSGTTAWISISRSSSGLS
jgi:hypothetical protein